jgi:glycosyltransferase involved in cell wall biosynthesis/SAM-dependent methyltransferase
MAQSTGQLPTERSGSLPRTKEQILADVNRCLAIQDASYWHAGAIEYVKSLVKHFKDEKGVVAYHFTKPFAPLASDPDKGADRLEFLHYMYNFVNVVGLLRLPGKARVLDVATGSGWVSHYLAKLGYRPTGIDICDDFVQMARQRVRRDPDIELADDEIERMFFTHNMECAPLPANCDRAFDAVILESCVHHFFDPIAALSHVTAALKDDGIVVVIEGENRVGPIKPEYQKVMDDFRTLERPLERNTLIEILQFCGLTCFEFLGPGTCWTSPRSPAANSLREDLTVNCAAMNLTVCAKTPAALQRILPWWTASPGQQASQVVTPVSPTGAEPVADESPMPDLTLEPHGETCDQEDNGPSAEHASKGRIIIHPSHSDPGNPASNGHSSKHENNGQAFDVEGNGKAAKAEPSPIAPCRRRGQAASASKRVLIVTTMVPFTRGGDRHMADSLRTKFREYGHDVDLIMLPFSDDWAQIPKQLIALKLLHLENYGDRLIAIRTPSYIINHPNKACWFIHHHRGAFDLWNSNMQSIPATPEGLEVRRLLARSDNEGLASAKRIYTNSRVVADRLEKFNQVQAEVLYPPLKTIEGFRCDEYGDYFFYGSRMGLIKRQHLAVQAMRHVKSGVKLVVAGNPDTPADRERIKKAVASSGAADRITVLDRFISEQEKQQLMANSLGCLYFPLGEDSYGYVGLEASYSAKAIITTTDSGGVLELVTHGRNGLVVNPDAASLARAMDQLYEDRAAAERMGKTARQRVDELNISWDHVIEALLK